MFKQYRDVFIRFIHSNGSISLYMYLSYRPNPETILFPNFEYGVRIWHICSWFITSMGHHLFSQITSGIRHLCLDVAIAHTPELRGWRRVKWMRVKSLDPQLTNSNIGTSLSCFLQKQKYSYRVSRQAVAPCLERN